MDFIRDSGGFCLPVMDCKDVYARALGHGKNNLNSLLTGRGKEAGKGYFKGFRRISHASHGLDARANDVDFFSPSCFFFPSDSKCAKVEKTSDQKGKSRQHLGANMIAKFDPAWMRPAKRVDFEEPFCQVNNG
jgi:hypothetical protein